MATKAAKKVRKRSDLKLEKKNKEQKKKERYIVFMVFLVASSMLFSGLYFFSSGGGGTPTEPDEEEPYFNSYDITPVGSNISVVDEIRPELIAIVKSSCVNFQTIRWVYNLSMPGLKSVTCDVAGPVRNRYYDICGRNLLFFKFTFKDITENTTKKLTHELDNRLDEYALKRAYIGVLSGSETIRIYTPGDLDVKKGDHARIFIFQKSDGSGLFGLERKRVQVGPDVSSRVVNLTDIMVQGTIASDFHLDTIEKNVNVTSSRFKPPKITVNETVDKETIMEISQLDGVDITTAGNKTGISFNSSLKDIVEILDREGLNYSLEVGSVLFRIPLDSDVERVGDVLKENRIDDLDFKKSGFVEIPGEVMINGKVVSIESQDNFGVILNMETEMGDTINITLSTMDFGEQVFVIGGAQAG